MSSHLDSVHIEPSSLGIHSEELLYAAIASLWRRKLLMVAIFVTALALGGIAALVMPEQYTAGAYIRGGFTASDAVVTNDDRSSGAAGISLAMERVIETHSRLLQSDQLARRVVERLGLERLPPEVREGSWLASQFYGNAADVPGHQEDMAARRLLRGLSVNTDPRAYLVAIRYTTADSGLAALIVNGFVAEYLRSTKLQTLSEHRSSAQANLSKQLATFGDKHPKVTKARVQLAAADNLLEEQLSKSSEEILQAAGPNVALAQTTTIPSSPNPPFVIGLSLLGGLVVGIGVALWLERGRWWRALSQYLPDVPEVPGTAVQMPGATQTNSTTDVSNRRAIRRSKACAA
jgi:uncharacterized protein involved in exopolysaccharide biosynthesis